MPRIEGVYEDVTPTCDYCGEAWEDGGEGEDWNGDTGAHKSCEYEAAYEFRAPTPPLRRFRLSTRYPHQRSEGLRGTRESRDMGRGNCRRCGAPIDGHKPKERPGFDSCGNWHTAQSSPFVRRALAGEKRGWA